MTRQQKLALATVIISSSVAVLDGSVVNLALPKIAADLHTNFATLQWIMDGYLLSLSALILLGGTLGDIYGRKRIYMIGLVGFGISSLLCAVVPNATGLVIMRIIQGIFGALLIPGALAIINTNFSQALRGPAFGLWTAWSAAATAIGPLLGGYIIDVSSWRWIFLINVPLVLLSAFLGTDNITESKDPAVRRVDWLGAILAVVSLGGITYGLIEGPGQAWSAIPVGAIVIGAVAGIIFLWCQSRIATPMLDLSLFRSRNFTIANISTFAMYGALSGFIFSLLIYLQTTVGFSSLQAGFATLPVSLFLVALSQRMGAWSGKYGPRLFMGVGPILVGVGVLMLLPLHAGSTYLLEVLPGMCVFSLGMATTVAPLTTTVMASAAKEHSGIASAVNNAVSRVAGLVIIALLGLFTVNLYQSAIFLCGILAIVAGTISLLYIQNDKTLLTK